MRGGIFRLQSDSELFIMQIMNKMRFSFLTAALAALFAAAAITGCSKAATASIPSDAALANQSLANAYIASVTPPIIGRLTPISISFVHEAKIPLAEGLSLSPRIRGTWEFTENKATFTPEKPYKAESTITLVADCAQLFESAADGAGNRKSKSERCYTQVFHVGTPHYAVQFDEVRYQEASTSYCISGDVVTDIPVSEAEISGVLNARYGLKKAPVLWQAEANGEKWHFTVDGIVSTEKPRTLSVAWNGKSLGTTKAQDKRFAGSKNFAIPAKAAFSILDINTTKQNTILVSFSKPLDTAQDIASFVTARNENGSLVKGYSANVRGNVLSLFSDSNFQNVRTVAFESGIKSADGILLAAGSSVQLSDHWDLPSVRFMNDNVILPTTQGAVFPIETRNLTGVLVQAYAIYERNITQFLQENELPDTSRLYRVGEPVWEKKIAFDWDNSMQNKYVARGLELSELVKRYPDGMFHIRVTFRRDQIKYVCNDDHEDFSRLPMPPDTIEAYSVPVEHEKSSWDYWENSNKSRDGYWRYDDDPCHPAFYMPSYNSRVLVSRNVLVSDIGIMAKRDNTGSLFVTVADIKKGKPLAGATVELRTYVGTPFATGKTDSNGNCMFTNADNTFVVTAKQGKQTSYLKIASSTSLSTSHFEIGGEKAKGGVKGAIYGERGVWRPGDELFLTFVLQDTQKTLPATIPVTFELVDPRGRITESQLLSKSVNGFYPIKTKTLADAPTGLWTARVTIGGNKWTKYVSIESVVPNHLDVQLDSDRQYLQREKNQFTLKGAWLHGAPTPNYDADVSVSFTPARTTFDGYSEYTFSTLSSDLEQNREMLWEGSLNSNSTATFKADLDAGRRLPGKLNAHFISRIHEPSGGFSTQSKTMQFSPYSRYVGIKLPKGDAARNMLLTDTDHTVEVVLLDAEGKPANNAKLTGIVYKIDWKWWWEKDAYTSATHVSSRNYRQVARSTVDISNGKGSFKFQVKYPDWGRYLVEVSDDNGGETGHHAEQIVYIDWPGWAGRAQETGSGSAAMLPLVASKKQYTVGENAEITFTANDEAAAYITIEKGGRVLQQQKIDTKKGSNVYKLPITEAMSPNIYVHLTLLQPHLQTANSLPIRLYGVIPVMVDNPKTKLEPVITAQESFEPNKRAAFTIKEQNGRAMTYTLAVVDEGLLGLTNYHAPNLRSEFYKKEASELENWDIYRYVMNAYSGKLETILAIGGAEGYEDNRERNENRFAPVVRYFGPYTLAAGETRTTDFQMPSYIGAVRAIVVAGMDGAYGMAEKTVPVKSELMVQANFPRTLGTGESISVPVTVFNGDPTQKTVTVTLASRGVINGSKSQEVTLPASASSTVTFPIETRSAGRVLFEATAVSGTAQAKTSVGLDIVSRGVPVNYRKAFMVNPGDSVTVSVDAVLERGTGTLLAELSPMPQIDLSSRVQYLVQYPHGCIEQITSGGFPQLFLPAYLKLGSAETNKIKENVISVFDRYPTYQTTSGAMGYWPGNLEPHAWGTCYATHFMLEAKNRGYSVPSSILNPALEWLASTASTWTSRSDTSETTQAYRLFVLALAGKADIGAMNRLESSSKDLDRETELLLAAAYGLCGRKSEAKRLCGSVWTSVDYRETGDTFSSTLRYLAVYQVACTQAGLTAQVASGAKEIATRLSSDNWLSTQETAWALYALLPYYTQQTQHAESGYRITVNTEKGQTEKADTFKAGTTTVALPFNYKTQQQQAVITNTGKSVLYGTLLATGMSVAGSEKRQSEGLKLSVRGLDTLKTANVGDTVPITVKVENTAGKDVKNIALTIPIGTCLEFTNERVGRDYDDDDDDYDERESTPYDYQDIRDNAVYTYFDLYRVRDRGEPNEITLTFNVTVAYMGDYYIPAIQAEAMYDANIRATLPGLRAKAAASTGNSNSRSEK